MLYLYPSDKWQRVMSLVPWSSWSPSVQSQMDLFYLLLKLILTILLDAWFYTLSSSTDLNQHFWDSKWPEKQNCPQICHIFLLLLHSLKIFLNQVMWLLRSGLTILTYTKGKNSLEGYSSTIMDMNGYAFCQLFYKRNIHTAPCDNKRRLQA